MDGVLVYLAEIAQDHVLLVAAASPVAVRLLGHWLPEELVMIWLGSVAASQSPLAAACTLGTAWLGHYATDHAVYQVGRSFVRSLPSNSLVARKVESLAARLALAPEAALAFVVARVFPLGRGAWLAACGVSGMNRATFAVVDALALVLHVGFWCGIGWVAGVVKPPAWVVGTAGAVALGAIAVAWLWRAKRTE